MKRRIGAALRRFRKKNGVRTRDGSISIHDMHRIWGMETMPPINAYECIGRMVKHSCAWILPGIKLQEG